MKTSCPFFLLIFLLGISVLSSAEEKYELVFSTFFGGSADEGIRDVEVDVDGNIYVAGTTRSADFPTTPQAFQKKLDTSLDKTRWGYNSDIFVAKFSPNGKLIWSTLLGGPNSEEAYGLEIDSKGNIIVHGRGAEGSPITRGVYQEQFMGCGGNDPGNPHNTAQNAYIAKLSSDGRSLIWASYFGIDHLHRDLALDQFDDIYVTWGVRPEHNDMYLWATWMNPLWNANAFQKEPQGGIDCGVAKISYDGRQVIWATFLGGSGDDAIEASIDVDKDGYVYVGLQTSSTDMPTTEGAFDRTHNGGFDWYVAKLLPDGSDIVYGTYIGDEGNNWLNTHNLVVDENGTCYSTTCATSVNFPTTAGVLQTTFGGGIDWGIVKLSPSGGLLAATLLGGSQNDNPDGIRIDRDGNLVLFGQTASGNFPVTANAHQPKNAGQDDALMVKMSPNLDVLLYSTYLGGDASDAGRAGTVDQNGNLIVAGESQGGTWPVLNAWQDKMKGNETSIIAKIKTSKK
jgi:hypothetical protein